MNAHDQDPVDRLRAADPAADVEPREGFADAVIAAATAEGAAPVDLDAERARRGSKRMAVLAIAASVALALAVGGLAGYGLAAGQATAGSGTGSSDAGVSDGDGAAPPISLPGEGGPAQGGALADRGAAESGSQDLSAQSSDTSYPYGYSSRSSFRSSMLLSSSGGRAAAYAYDAAASSTAEKVGAFAAALGVEGAPEIRDGMWVVGPQDGSAASFSASLDGTLGFWFWSGGDPWACGEACVAPEEGPAIAAARDLMTRLGEDPAAYEYTSETWEGSATRSVSIWTVIDGQRIDSALHLDYAAEGIVSGYGALAAIVPFGEYEVVSEQEAFERLSDPRFGAQLTTLPEALREGVAGEEWTPPTAAPSLPEPGASVSWSVNDVEIVSARLGLASHWQADGSVLLVPTYEFTDSAGGTWSVIAVAESALDFSAAEGSHYGWIE
ncbi:hypothetical protein [Microbacterium sp. KNMS]